MLFFSIFLSILLFMNFYIRKDFICPTFFMLVSYVMASWLIYLNAENWLVHINLNFYIYIILFICSWLLASFLIRLNFQQHKLSKIIVRNLKKNSLKEKIFFVVSIFLCMGYVFILIKRFAGTNILLVLRAIYDYDESTDSSHFLQHQIEIVSVGLFYVSFFCILKKKFCMCGEKKLGYLVFTLIISLFVVFMTTDRNKFIRLIIFCFCIWCFFMRSYSTLSRKTTNKIIFKYAILLGIIMMFAFYGLGKAKQYTSNFERMIGIYGGSGLYNFNLRLESFNGNFLFGKRTFSTLLSTLNNFIPISQDLFLPIKKGTGFIIFNTGQYVYASNIYAAITNYYIDFGVCGIIFFSLFLGTFFEIFYQLAKNKGGFMWVLYAAFIYPTFYITISDQFFDRLHLGLIYEFFWIVILYFFLFKSSTKYFHFCNHRKIVI